VAAPCSRLGAPRAATVCRLDLASPRASRLLPLDGGRATRSGRSPVVHVRSRSSWPRHTPEGGVRAGSRPRTCGHTESHSSSPEDVAERSVVAAAGDLPAGGATVGRDEVVRGPEDRPHDAHQPNSILIRAVLWYQRAMEGRPSPCRFTPSCSAYALEALEVHGTFRGICLTLRRFLRCRPFGPSGWDPVPESRHTKGYIS